MARISTMPRDSAPFVPVKPINCHRLAMLVPARLPVEEKRIAHLVMVVAQRAVLAASADGEPGMAGMSSQDRANRCTERTIHPTSPFVFVSGGSIISRRHAEPG